jgi:hypothetical protein
MAGVAFFESIKTRFSSVKNKDFFDARFDNVDNYATISEPREGLKTFSQKEYPLSDFSYDSVNAIPDSALPFRVKFINIGIESYGPNNPPPIGIAVIGFNNYIL